MSQSVSVWERFPLYNSGGNVLSMMKLCVSHCKSQVVCFWVVVFHHRRLMAFLTHTLFDMSVLDPLMNALFWGRYDFHISLSDRNISGNVCNRLLGSCMVDMESPSPRYYMTFWEMSIYSETLHWLGISLTCDLVNEQDLVFYTDFLTKSRKISYERTYATDAASHQQTPTPRNTWSCSFRTCNCSIVLTSLSWTCHFSRLRISNILWCFYFAFHKKILTSKIYSIQSNTYFNSIGKACTILTFKTTFRW